MATAEQSKIICKVLKLTREYSDAMDIPCHSRIYKRPDSDLEMNIVPRISGDYIYFTFKYLRDAVGIKYSLGRDVVAFKLQTVSSDRPRGGPQSQYMAKFLVPMASILSHGANELDILFVKYDSKNGEYNIMGPLPFVDACWIKVEYHKSKFHLGGYYHDSQILKAYIAPTGAACLDALKNVTMARHETNNGMSSMFIPEVDA